MRREEALQRIVDNNFAGEYGFDLQILIDCMSVAREMIINSQFPSEDYISRQAVIDMTGLSEWFDSSDSYNEFVIALSELPPVTPQLKYEDIAKAFQVGLAFGFGEKHDEMDKVMEEVKKAATPQYTDAEIQKMQEMEQAEIEKAYELGKSVDILEKIREEIEKAYCKVEDDYDKGRNYGLYMATQIIDKYKAESEDKE